MTYSNLCRNGINRKSLATEDVQQAIRQAEVTTLTEEEIIFYRQQLAVLEESARKASDMAHRIRFLLQEDDQLKFRLKIARRL